MKYKFFYEQDNITFRTELSEEKAWGVLEFYERMNYDNVDIESIFFKEVDDV